jgi:regulatory protein
MEITDIAPLDKKRRKVYIDGQYAFPLYVSELRKYNIEAGAVLEENVYDDICSLLMRRVRERILYLITDYDRSEQNIRQKISMAGYRGSFVDDAIDSLKEYGYIDDLRFARYYAESMRDTKGRSAFAISRSLYEKGISRDVIDTVMGELDIDEDAQILKALSSKGYNEENIRQIDDKERQKLISSLMRKGFSYDLISIYVRK